MIERYDDDEKRNVKCEGEVVVTDDGTIQIVLGGDWLLTAKVVPNIGTMLAVFMERAAALGLSKK